MTLGILLAFCSLIGWGFGDFLIQKTTRRVGVLATIVFESVAVTVLLFPFVFRDLSLLLLTESWSLLLLLSGCILLAMLCNRHALKSGKLSVVVPIVSLELPLTIGLSLALANESLTLSQALFILLILSGVILVAIRDRVMVGGKKVWLERGTLIALMAAVFLALSSFLSGLSGRLTSPLLTVWFVQASLAVVSLTFLIIRGRGKAVAEGIRHHYKLLTVQTFCTTGAWICFIFATKFIPISITMAISEGYIALATVLGILINKERINRHQIMGLCLLVLGISFLALFF